MKHNKFAFRMWIFFVLGALFSAGAIMLEEGIKSVSYLLIILSITVCLASLWACHIEKQDMVKAGVWVNE